MQFYKTETIFHGKIYRILTPVSPLVNTYVYLSLGTPFVFANKEDFTFLASLFALLTEIKDIIIYLPTRTNQTDYLNRVRADIASSSDMVLCHHSLQLKRALFKEFKKRLSKSNLVSLKINTMKFSDWDFDESFWHKENKDLLDVVHQQSTLFLAGSTKIFEQLARECLSFRRDVAKPPYHSHTHLDTYLRHGKFPYWEDMQFCFYDEKVWDKWLAEQEEV